MRLRWSAKLPAGRLGFLARAETVWGVLDGDAAGRAAAERFGAQIGGRWRTLRLPDGCDLNDLAAHHKLHAGERLRVTAPHALTAGGM